MSIGRKIIGIADDAIVCNTDSKYAFGADSSFTSNIATYQLDGNANDTTGNYNGTATNVTFSSTGAYLGQAASFNGSSSKIDTSLSLDTNNVSGGSISLWFKTSQTTPAQILIGSQTSQNGASFGSSILLGPATGASASESISVWDYNSGTTSAFYTEGGSDFYQDNNWHHLVITSTSSSKNIYIDGISQTISFIGSASAAANLKFTDIQIGATLGYTGTNYFDGDLDQIRIFDRRITASEVATLYAETTSTASSINPLNEGQGFALYNFDYDASDAGGLYDGTPTDITFGVGGAIGNYGAALTGTSSQINFPDIPLSAFNATTVSVSLWVNMQALTSGHSSGSYVFRGRGNWIIQVTTNGVIFAKFNTSFGNNGTNDLTYNFSGGTNLNQWYHIVVTDNGTATSGLKLYVDGVLRDSNSGYANIDDNNWIAGIANYAGRAGGNFKVDQLRIFSSVLTSDQVEDLYAEEACVHTATTTDNYFPLADGSSDAVAYYKLDNSAEDSVSTNDGTESNIEYRFGRYGQAAVFNGSSSHIDIGAVIPNTDTNYSISTWINIDSGFTSGNRTILGAATSNGGTEGAFRLQLSYVSTNTYKITIARTVGSGSNNFYYSTNWTNSSINTGQWYHIVATYNNTGSVGKTYLNGVLVDSFSLSTQASVTAVTNNLIGGQRNNLALWLGKIDQVRIYSTVLDSDQVSQLYNEKPETDTSNFKTVLYEGTGATQYISNIGIDLETNGGLLWIKNRDATYNHVLYDHVRNSFLYSNLTNSEDANTSISYEKSGFQTTSTASAQNANNNSYVGWVWKGGGDASNVAVNSITGSTPSIASDVSANTEAGFSIVRHTGTSTVGTIAHGLNQAPEFIMTKSSSHDTGDGFTVYADGLAQSDSYLNLASPNIPNPNSVVWTTNAPTTDIFNVGTATGTNSSGKTYISYCWHSVSGYSKIGTYEGNGTTRNVDLGFDPSWIMIKNVDTGSTAWNIVDTRRDTDTTLNLFLQANTSGAEANTTICSLITDGFSVTGTNTFNNSSGDTFLYMAFK